MKSVYTYKDATWIDLVSPTAEEVADLTREYGLSETVAESLTSPSLRHAVEFADNHAYIVLHFPAFKDSTDGDAAFELDFVIGENFVITARYGEIEAIKRFEEWLGKVNTPDAHDTIDFPHLSFLPESGRNVLFFGILASALESFDRKLVEVDHWIREVEQKIFDGHEKETIFDLSEASRHLIDFKKITAVWPDAFEMLLEKGSERFGPEFAKCAAEIITSFEKHSTKLGTLTEATRELRETNASILSTKQNELMKFLTIFSVAIAVVTGIVLIWLSYLAIRH